MSKSDQLGNIFHDEMLRVGAELMEAIEVDQGEEAPSRQEMMSTLHYTLYVSIHAGHEDGFMHVVGRCAGGTLEQTTQLFGATKLDR